ncbi:MULTISPECIES: hypothetical protein [Nitrosomonas]|nr:MULTISPECIES: hypothetical protein [Nitrosomonas]QOJ10036.1 MAG: hypothetical protein HRU73_11685 [Nitrosomonas sp. H1_AOB3]
MESAAGKQYLTARDISSKVLLLEKWICNRMPTGKWQPAIDEKGKT